jgi:hypothetical protein
MTRLLLPVVIIAGLSCCSKASDHSASTSKIDLREACPIYLRHVASDGSLDPFPFVRPEHIASINPTKPWYEGEAAMWVELTDAGAERMYRETKGEVGSRIAIFCGEKEIERAVLRAPIQKGFRFALPDRAPNNAFKPKPLRGSA